jgi:hypothetical protein
MARLFDDASSQYLSSATTPIIIAPITIAFWGKTDNNAALQCGVGIFDGGTTNNQNITLNFQGASGDVIRHTHTAGVAANVDSAGSFWTDVWHHACATK